MSMTIKQNGVTKSSFLLLHLYIIHQTRNSFANSQFSFCQFLNSSYLFSDSFLQLPPNFRFISYRKMRRRRDKKKTIDIQFQPESEPEEQQDIFQAQEPQQNKKRKRPSKHTPKKSRQKRQNKQMQMSQQSCSSQIVQIHNKQGFVSDHVRPQFLKRWDGISNELKLTERQYKDLSPMLQVYWRVKSKNMKAIVFLQFGKMEFFAFQNDAIYLSEMSKKRIKRFSKFLMVNFWYKQIEVIKKQLFQRRVPILIMNEIQDPAYKLTHGLIRRQVVEVITPALHPLMESNTTARERLLLAVFYENQSFGFVLLDGQTNEFYVQEGNDDIYFHEIRRILNRFRPVELVIPYENHDEIAQMARQISNPYIVKLRPEQLQENPLDLLDNIIADNRASVLRKMKQLYLQESKKKVQYSKIRSLKALILVRQYLGELSLKQKIFNQGIFKQGDGEEFRAPFFDSQVYQNLELFRLNQSDEDTYCKKGTLLHYIDHCRTQQGRKLLHRWLDCPPITLHQILERQQAIKQLLQSEKALKLHDKLFAYQKLGRRLGDVYHWIERESERGKIILTRGINFQKEYDQSKNPAVIRLREIIELVNTFKQYELLLDSFKEFSLKSKLWRKYTELEDFDHLHLLQEDELDQIERVPKLSYVAEAVLRDLSYDPITGHIEPAPGLNEVFDENKRQFERIMVHLQEQLNKWRQFFGNKKVQFISVRAKNQIQVPKGSISTKGKSNPHKDLIFSSETSAAIRYTTAQCSALSMEQAEFQEAMANAYEPFLQKILAQFARHRNLWQRYVRSSAWIDALMSLAQASRRMSLRCLPNFRDQGVLIKSGVHPSLSEVLQNIVPNDLKLQANERTLLLTGPNMGGKSTLLKQTCLMVILAQLGCYVPARQYSAPVFDQIFCRMGASDRIYQGKSTFYVQLQETKRILNRATTNSLVVIDELGRGTSTFDGMAIAQAVLDYLIFVINPTTLFSTHYSQITERYTNNQKVKLAKMGYQFDNQNLMFTYQLCSGVAEKSFANNASKLVGIKDCILKRAEQKSEEMHRETNRKKMLRQACRLAEIIVFKQFDYGDKRRKQSLGQNQLRDQININQKQDPSLIKNNNYQNKMVRESRSKTGKLQ